jgi:hypothetical protein
MLRHTDLKPEILVCSTNTSFLAHKKRENIILLVKSISEIIQISLLSITYTNIQTLRVDPDSGHATVSPPLTYATKPVKASVRENRDN